MATKGKVDREAGTVTYTFHENDHYVTFALLWSALAWVFCGGCVLLHVAGVGSVVADVVALALSVAVGLAWCVIVFVAEW